MAKKFFSLNPFRRKKRGMWKKGNEDAAAEETTGAEEADVEQTDVELTGAEDSGEDDLLDAGGGEDVDDILSGVDLTDAAADDGADELLSADELVPEDAAAEEGLLDESILEEGILDEAAVPAPEPLLEETPLDDAVLDDVADGLLEDNAAAEELEKAFESTPEPASAPEPPSAILPDGEEKPVSTEAGEIRDVRDSMESLKRRAMTVGQLRETIEKTIEARIAGMKDVVGKVQGLFQEGAGKLGDVGQALSDSGQTGKKVQDLSDRLDQLGQTVSKGLDSRINSLNEQLEGLRTMVGELRGDRESMGTLGNELKAALDLVARNVNAMSDRMPAEGLKEQLTTGQERLVAWLERLNVQAEAVQKESQKASEDRTELMRRLDALQREKADVGQLRSQLNRVRGNLSSGLQELKEELWRSRIARSFLKGRLETALEPAEAALAELDTVLRNLAQQ